MARQETEREDLLREATALVERIELAAAGDTSADAIVAGFRKEGALSIFFGSHPVYQFNTAGQLRRAYAGDLLLKAEAGRLVSLERVRRRDEVQLVRHELTEDEQMVFIAEMHYRLRHFLTQLNTGQLATVRQVPAEADVRGRLVTWLAEHELVAIARGPHVQA